MDLSQSLRDDEFFKANDLGKISAAFMTKGRHEKHILDDKKMRKLSET